MARVTVEDCLRVVPNRYELVRVAARRARQIINGAPLLVGDTDKKDKPTVTALREIAAGTVDATILDQQEAEQAHEEAIAETFGETVYTPEGAGAA